jgi:hypothetical protein
MKRLLLASLLCVVAVIVAPVASAGAAEPKHVECNFTGTATFETELGPVPTVGLDKYGFKSSNETPPANECNGKAGFAEVNGAGHLSCTLSPGLGLGGLAATFENGLLKAEGKEFKLETFEFVGTGPVVTFEAKGKDEATGETFVGVGKAEFVETQKALKECEKGKLKAVAFKATAHGVVH